MIGQKSTLPSVDQAEKWYVVDAKGMIVGRVAARVAKLVKGKLGASYTPHLSPNIHVVVINADQVIFTGNKERDKEYRHHSMWRTGLKRTSPFHLRQEKPTEVLRKAIHGMLPKNRLGVRLNKNVKVYAGTEHPHGAQDPKPMVVRTRAARVKNAPKA